MKFNPQQFYCFCKNNYLNEYGIINQWHSDILNLIYAINSVYQKSHEILHIPIDEKYYPAWFLFDFLINKTKKYPLLNTPQLENYLNTLPQYSKNLLLSEVALEKHGHSQMQVMRFYSDFCQNTKMNSISSSESIDEIERFLNKKVSYLI
jgi:hypothetical protein